MNYGYFDLHCDTLPMLLLKDRRLRDSAFHIDAGRARKLGRYAQFFSICTTCWKKRPDSEQLYADCLTLYRKELEENKDWLVACGSRAEVEAAWESGKCGALLSLEGAEAIGCDPGRLEEAARDGVRLISLTWNHANALGGSHITGEGLTAQGREFVRRAQKLGILIDVSHGSDRLFYDVCEIAEKPIVASHSNSRYCAQVSRNLADDQFRCLVALGGVAGINLCSEFVSWNSPVTLDDIRRHVDRWLALGGDGHIALGGDWDGIEGLPEGMEGVDGWALLPPHLREHGIANDVIDRLTSGAVLRVLDDAGAQSVRG